MTATTTAHVPCDPGSRTASQWSARLAALKSRDVPDDDHRVIECINSLSYWRVRRVLDKERGTLAAEDIPALADILKHAHPAVT
jgi:hypothetical protein